MPTADMHGGTVEFKDRDGRPVAFELVRVGTMKELATVKAALDNVNRSYVEALDQAEDLGARLAKSGETRVAAEAAYNAEKQALARMTTARDSARETNLVIHQKLDDQSVKLETADKAIDADQQAHKDAAEERLRLYDLIESEKDKNAEAVAAYSDVCERHGDALDAKARLTSELESARAELENLMTAKASLEETNTALEVSQKKLAASQEAFDVAMLERNRYSKDLAECRGEFGASRAALADLKAELLTEGNRFKTILDTLAEKIAGE